MERTYEAPSNEAPHMILGYHQGRLVTYLQFEFSGIAWGQAKNPKDEHDTFARLSQSELHVVSHQNLPQSKDVEVLLLFVGCIGNFIVSYLICMFQDSVPAGSYNDPFLSSVIFMVAPTWCHGAIWGNPLQGECWQSWILNSHILT